MGMFTLGDTLFLSKESLYNHIDHFGVIFARLWYVVLEVNSLKYIFGLRAIYYLGYVINKECFKPDEKLHGFMDIVWTNSTTEAWSFIGMVQ